MTPLTVLPFSVPSKSHFRIVLNFSVRSSFVYVPNSL